MNTETVTVAIPRDGFSFVGLKHLVYEILEQKSTNLNPITLDEVTSTLHWNPPVKFQQKNPEDYFFLSMEMPDYEES